MSKPVPTAALQIVEAGLRRPDGQAGFDPLDAFGDVRPEGRSTRRGREVDRGDQLAARREPVGDACLRCP